MCNVETKLAKGRAFFARVEQSIGRPVRDHIIDLFMDNAAELDFTDEDCLMVGNIVRADKGLSPVARWWTRRVCTCDGGGSAGCPVHDSAVTA